MPTTTTNTANETYRFETLSISTVKDNPHVTIVTLNRRKKYNAIDTKMWREIGHAFHRLGSEGSDCRCILLNGSGNKAFCAGIDTSDEGFNLIGGNFGGNDDDDGDGDGDSNPPDVARRALSSRGKILEMQRAFTALEECPVPIVAAIHGFCLGAGIDLTCCADIRLCSPSAIFGVREVRLGLAADIGTLQRLPKIVGHGSRVNELCLTGADFGAEEAARIGYVSRVSKTEDGLLPMAMDVCMRIAANSPVAVVGTKQSLLYSRDHSVSDGLQQIATYNTSALLTDDLMESFTAQVTKSTPKYSSLLPHARL